MTAKLTKLHTALLTYDDPSTGGPVSVEVTRIGRGRYTTAWANGTKVYLQTSDRDASKEILSNLAVPPRNPHTPDCTLLDSFAGDYRLYSTPRYRKVTARETPQAWKQLKTLIAMRDDARREACKDRSRSDLGYAINDAFRNIIDADQCGPAPRLPASLYEALKQLLDEASRYGEYTIEFRRANVAADADGTLILLDPLFDLAEVRRAKEERMKRAARRY